MTKLIHWVLDHLLTRIPLPDYVVKNTFSRWTLFKLKDKRHVFLHHFYPHTDLFSHSHVQGLISFGLWGGYSEESWSVEGENLGARQWSAPWVRHFSASFRHRVTVKRGAWTLCITDADFNDWGFWTQDDVFINWLDRTVDEGHSRDSEGNQILAQP